MIGRTMAAAVVLALALQPPAAAPGVLPAAAAARLADSLAAAERHPRHIWRDTSPFNPDGTVNAYVEIPRGDRRKWEYDMRRNARAIDRVMPSDVGGYPVNYGFLPQTIAYDGDPFDALVLGPPLPGGTLVRGAIVGLMHMTDEKGVDSKVVLAPADAARPNDLLTSDERKRIETFFDRYKRHEPGKFSDVTGWGPAVQGRAFLERTHGFFRGCRNRGTTPCTLPGGGVP